MTAPKVLIFGANLGLITRNGKSFTYEKKKIDKPSKCSKLGDEREVLGSNPAISVYLMSFLL